MLKSLIRWAAAPLMGAALFCGAGLTPALACRHHRVYRHHTYYHRSAAVSYYRSRPRNAYFAVDLSLGRNFHIAYSNAGSSYYHRRYCRTTYYNRSYYRPAYTYVDYPVRRYRHVYYTTYEPAYVYTDSYPTRRSYYHRSYYVSYGRRRHCR